MSECISSRGEYSSHEYENGECKDCGHVDLDRVRADAKVEALREAAGDLDDAMIIDGKGSYRAGPDNCANWLRTRADNLEKP